VIVNRDIPMKYISPAAEEMLAYGNTVPEWLCPSRQEKVFYQDVCS
jgi:integrator complex subunit 9